MFLSDPFWLILCDYQGLISPDPNRVQICHSKGGKAMSQENEKNIGNDEEIKKNSKVANEDELTVEELKETAGGTPEAWTRMSQKFQ